MRKQGRERRERVVSAKAGEKRDQERGWVVGCIWREAE